MKIIPISALRDNYIWAITNEVSKKVIIVDPGEALPVERFLQQSQYELVAILITHHHADHTHGALSLIKHRADMPVYGGASEKIDAKNKNVSAATTIMINDFPPISVIDIPGHTVGHVAYLMQNHLFCGDTLFSAGCGRIFEGTVSEMYDSLMTLHQLPDNIFIYCGHEYTHQNCQFAQMVEPSNKALAAHIQKINALIHNKTPTLPSTIQLEKAINPFFRCAEREIKNSVEKKYGVMLIDEQQVFAKLREWKNEF